MDEGRAEFGEGYRAGLKPKWIALHLQSVWRREKRKHGGVIARNLIRDFAQIDVGQQTLHAESDGVDVAKLVKLQNAVMHAREFVMGRQPFCLRIVCGVLEGGEIKDVHVGRDDDDAAGMLARRAFDPSAMGGKISGIGSSFWRKRRA